MSQVSERGPAEPPTPDPEAVLRGKYFDYFSARIADVLLALSPDEMFVLAREAARESAGQEEMTFSRLVDLATIRLIQRLELPSFEQWLVEYREDPEKYEREMLGLWRSDLESDTAADGAT